MEQNFQQIEEIQRIKGIWGIIEAWTGFNLKVLFVTCVFLALW